ncbi:hypothetical protein GGH94_005329 [Coemansia aciculifera]|uniref:Uncharacterized protein n=1 Tax=Coemansia aciculifera TaxID=417176 RepID=A0A9W8IDQ4_9FUNG|nr:hypothetical protein GGH94_005329 [Coemansia aciculifera]KAJ2870904.1 hypothetical protein GGH93_005229 [Coemansia aciculifera]
MASLSSFQLLTPSIAESIIDCITCSNNVFVVGAKSESEQHKKLLIPLLSTLNLLSTAPYDGCPFPDVYIVSLVFDPRGYGPTTIGSLLAMDVNVSAFVERLSLMAPAATEIRLEGGCISRNLFPVASQHMASLAKQLFQRYTCVVHNVDYEEVFTGRQLDSVQDLVNFKYAAVDGYETVLRVARQNALTLKRLDIKFKDVVDVSGLIRDESGGCVVYPRLCLMLLRQMPALQRAYEQGEELTRSTAQHPVFPDAVPFPVLRRLHVEIEYPFGDDTLFRGNADTLVCLDIKLYPALVDVTSRYKLFTLASYPNLRYVKTHRVCNAKAGDYSSGSGPLDEALSIAPHALVRTIGGILSSNFMSISYSPFREHTCIRVLHLPDTQPNFWDVLDVFGQLPNLVELCTMPLHFPIMGIGLPYNVNAPAYLHADKLLAGKQFRIWKFNDSKQFRRTHIVSCLRAMTQVCSVFDCVDPQAGNSKIFDGDMDDHIVVNGFKQHSGHLWQIITECCQTLRTTAW